MAEPTASPQRLHVTTDTPWNRNGHDPSIAMRHCYASWFPWGVGN
jgi:hypothetical protein